MKPPSILITVILAVYPAYLVAIPPENDNFTNATVISGSSGSKTGFSLDAGIEPGEPAHAASRQSYKSIWFAWSPPTAGEYTFEVVGAAFDPWLGVYTGDSLTNLTRAAEFRFGNTHFYAQPNITYYITVASLEDKGGNITLKYYPDTLSEPVEDSIIGMENYTLHASRRGAIAYEPYYVTFIDVFRTNKYGYRYCSSFYTSYKTTGLTVIGDKGDMIISHGLPESLTNSIIMVYFDGKELYMYDRGSGTMVLYDVKKDTLEKSGTLNCGNPYSLYVKGPYVIFDYQEFDDTTFLPVHRITVYNRKLKKMLWEEQAALGQFTSFSDKGIYQHLYNSEYGVQLSQHKKGKQKWRVHFPYSYKKFLACQTDRKGNTLYWYYSLPYPNYTNEPLTLISSKGKRALDQVTLPGVGIVWLNSNFEKNRFFVSPPPSGNTRTIYGYKLGKNITSLGSIDVNFMTSMQILNSKLTITQMNPGPPYSYGLLQYDTNLKNLQWMVPMTEGYVIHVDKDVFMRQRTVIDGNTTNLHLQIFNKKGMIAEHAIAP